MFLKDSTVLITGGNGFLRKHVVSELRNKGINDIITPLVEKFGFKARTPFTEGLKKTITEYLKDRDKF